MKKPLSSLEARLQAMVEGGVARLFSSGSRQDDLQNRLIAEMKSNTRQGSGSQVFAPNLYILKVSPGQASTLEENPTLIDELVRRLHEAGRQEGLHFTFPPVVRVIESPQVSRGEIEILAEFSLENLPDTSNMQMKLEEDTAQLPENAFLIVNGTDIFPLNKPILNIGRRPDNDLVIDDPRISRLHAQLRAIHGRYLIFDLGSSGGTFVNGVRIQQVALAPGDVISLADVPLVYGQENSLLDETQDIPL